MHEKWATPDEVRDAAGGVAQNTLWRWVRLGLLPKPTLVSGGPGKGTRNRWPREALERARFVVEQREAGYTLAEIAAMVVERWPDRASPTR